MARIALEFTYYTDIIEVPNFVEQNIVKYQREFDKWLYDKNNNHGLWIIDNGEKKAVSFDSSDFVDYLNKYIISDNNLKAKIIQTGLPETPEKMRVLFF